MVDLAKRKCVACSGETPTLEGKELEDYLDDLGGNWTLVNDHHIEKEFAFNDFQEALAFTNKVGALAEEERHHPDINLSWGKVRIVLWTHKINGLSESDFILAAKIDLILSQLQNS